MKNKVKIIILTVASLLAAILYRLGGIGKPFKTWMRDWLIPPLAYGVLLFFWHPVNLLGWLMFLPAIALTGGALTTYWDKLFGKDNFFMHGFMIGLGAFPLFWAGIHWWMILIRAVILAVIMGGVNYLVHKYQIKYSDWIEELTRGFAILATVILLLL